MIKIKFYKNGYITTGHSDNLTCAQISAMQYVIEGAILAIDKKAKCKDGGSGTGYTALLAENEAAIKLLNNYKKDIEKWLKSEVDENKYKIINKNKKIKWENILK
jgi:hypothetical protein